MSECETLMHDVLLPMRQSLINAALALGHRQNVNGMLTQWESFALTLCLSMREVVDIALEGSDEARHRDMAAMIRVADDAIFAMRWPAEDWWPYLARTQYGRDTLSLVRHIESEIALGHMTGLDIYDGFTEAVRAGEGMMEAWELDQTLLPCVGVAVRATV